MAREDLEYDLQVPSDFFWGRGGKLFFFPRNKMALPTVITEVVVSSPQFSIEYRYGGAGIVVSRCDVDETAEFL